MDTYPTWFLRFVDSDELSADDIKELQDILNGKGTGRNKA